MADVSPKFEKKTIKPQIKKLNKPQVQETGRKLLKLHHKQNA